MELREYQIKIGKLAFEKLEKYKFVYISAEVRCGKTLMALESARLFGAKKVLFVTKIRAFTSVKGDYDIFGFKEHFDLTITNAESLHKTLNDYDLIVSDEHHKYGSYPKPSKGQDVFKKKFYGKPVICLSGTPSPESYSQFYHQLNLTKYAPFSNYPTFYKWAKDFVDVRQMKLSHGTINDYSRADHDKIFRIIEPYFITYTQKEAGFTTTIDEEILEVEMDNKTYALIERLKRDLVIEGKDEVILADTAVKLIQKVHQMCSGTVRFESGNSLVFDYSKAVYIFERFANKKIVIFYKFKAELDALKSVFKENLTTELSEFNSTNKSIALQIISGREGINLSKAEAIVYYNIDFSAVSYWQSRDRLTTMDRTENKIYWIFAKAGIEQEIYKTVSDKKDFTLSIFKKWKK
jgi:hypothetical protein